MKRTFAGLNKRPKSRRGWQKWHRKYALAFFSDQLGRVEHSASKRHYVKSLLKNWEKRFRAECAIERPEQHVFLPTPTNIVEDQISFVTEYVACAIIDGAMEKNYEKVEHFLSIQGAQNIGQRFELRFVGGFPPEAYAYMDSLNEIDIADVFYITDFECMDVCRPKLQKWTKRTVTSFVDEIKKDVLFDFPQAVFTVEGPTNNVCFTIFIEVDQAARDLKALQCTPRSFAERFRGGRKKL